MDERGSETGQGKGEGKGGVLDRIWLWGVRSREEIFCQEIFCRGIFWRGDESGFVGGWG